MTSQKEINPEDYVTIGSGSLDDLMHPQATYENARVNDSLVIPSLGDYGFLERPFLSIEGSRPRIMGLGSKNFKLHIFVDTEQADSISYEEQISELQNLEEKITGVIKLEYRRQKSYIADSLTRPSLGV